MYRVTLIQSLCGNDRKDDFELSVEYRRILKEKIKMEACPKLPMLSVSPKLSSDNADFGKKLGVLIMVRKYWGSLGLECYKGC